LVLDGVSVVTTTFNEEENLPRLIREVRRVLAGFPHEIIVVDDDSEDSTYEIALRMADKAYRTARLGQTRCLLLGMRVAKYESVVTIDADLENPPRLIPRLVEMLGEYDVVNASRSVLPRPSERLAARLLGGFLGVSDVFSNFRAFRKHVIDDIELQLGETFGGELLLSAVEKGYRVGELVYNPPPRRSQPRIGGRVKANLRLLAAVARLARRTWSLSL